MFFVIPEMPSKTFVIVFKKLPDHLHTKLGNGRFLSCSEIVVESIALERDRFQTNKPSYTEPHGINIDGMILTPRYFNFNTKQ